MAWSTDEVQMYQEHQPFDILCCKSSITALSVWECGQCVVQGVRESERQKVIVNARGAEEKVSGEVVS